ncbi:hypothetical protein [Actinomadura macra]|uniref:hypothetical protein n=1 Tax=Actinomadura macra TaxID=46164 RepID=UPI000833FCE3|nr:hypothetical protein [Actinomadura macra]
MSAMMIATDDWLVLPWYSQVYVNGDDPPSDTIPAAEPMSSSACEGSTLLIFPSGSDVEIRVRAESWTTEPLTGDPRFDLEAATWTLHCPAGKLTVSNGGHGSSWSFPLPDPGSYQVRINAFHTDTRQLYDQALERSTDSDDPAFQIEVAKLTGRELWLLRLWPNKRPQDVA